MPAGDPFRLRLFCNMMAYGSGAGSGSGSGTTTPEPDLSLGAAWGWSEEYWLCTRSVVTALQWGADLCNRRRLWFGLGVEIVYAFVSDGPASRDSWAIDLDRIYAFPGGVPQPEYPDNPWVDYCYCTTSRSGRFGQRHLRGVPDDWINGVRPTYAPGVPLPTLAGTLPPITLGPGQYLPDLILTTTDLVGLQRSYLDALLRYTGYLTRGPAGGPTWTVEPLWRVAWTGVRKKDLTGPWHRVSCDGGWACWHGTSVGPTFDFCGACTGVVTTFFQRPHFRYYMAPCHWYAGEPPWPPPPAPVPGIRFYEVSRWAPCYLGQLRFGPKISEPGYSNGLQAGEVITRGPRVLWPGRNVLPTRDGSHPDVTPRQAAGLEPWPGF